MTLRALPASVLRQGLLDDLETAREIARRKARKRFLWDMRFVAELLYPPDDPGFGEFWKRFGDPQAWLLDACLLWKMRAGVWVPKGFEISRGRGGVRDILERDTFVDFNEFTTLVIMQSRETLKTAIRRIDFIHDLAFYPFMKGVHCASVWFAHKLERGQSNSGSIKGAMCASDRFVDTWGGILVPEHRDPDNWGTKDSWCTPVHPKGAPEASATFLAVKTRFEGGRYKSGHFDDLVTGEDRDSQPVREQKKKNIEDRENERDKTQGIRIIQGTDYHPQDAYQKLKVARRALTIRLPCLVGNVKKFWDFVKLENDERARRAKFFTRVCEPVFKHLDIITLANTYDEQGRVNFASQMLLAPEEGGRRVFEVSNILEITRELAPKNAPGYIIMDPAFKKQENKYTGDYTAIAVVVWDEFGRRVVLDGEYRNDWSESDAFACMANFAAENPSILAIYSEQKFVGDINEHWRRFAYENNCRFGAILSLEEAGQQNKMTRIKALDHPLRSGKIVFVKDTPIARAFRTEAEQYDPITGAASNDDALDVVSMSYDSAIGEPLFNVRSRMTPFGERQKPERKVIPLPGRRRW